jgi:hypothetical protein
MVIVPAVEIVSHAGRPTCLDEASLDIRSYSDDICGGAGVVPGRAWVALMSSLRASESFDMSAPVCLKLDGGAGPRFSLSCRGRLLSLHIMAERISVPHLFGKLFSETSMFTERCPPPLCSDRSSRVDPVIKKPPIGNDPLQSASPPG